MAVKAVVFDIGGVLEITGPMDFDRRWEARLGLAADTLGRQLDDVWRAGSIGTMSEAEVRIAVRDRAGLTDEQVDAVLADMWEQYLGVGNTELIDYVRTLRPRWTTGIVSNSFVGAREREQAAYGFEDLVGQIVYSHEVGVSKPDRRIFDIACARFGVRPDEMVFVDDVPPIVEAATAYGIKAVLRRDNRQTIADIEAHVLRGLIRDSDWLMRVLHTVRATGIPDAWVGAGALRDLVWGELYGDGYDTAAVRDIDVVYFDPNDLDRAGDERATAELARAWPEVPWEAINQAAVHTWYGQVFGDPDPEPLTSVDEAIGTWPETATAVAVRLAADDVIEICAPFGLGDLIGGVWRPNLRRISPERSAERLARQRPSERWPAVRVIR